MLFLADRGGPKWGGDMRGYHTSTVKETVGNFWLVYTSWHKDHDLLMIMMYYFSFVLKQSAAQQSRYDALFHAKLKSKVLCRINALINQLMDL